MDLVKGFLAASEPTCHRRSIRPTLHDLEVFSRYLIYSQDITKAQYLNS